MRLALLTLFAVFALAACGGGGEAEEPTPAAPDTTAEATTEETETGAATSELPETPLNTTLEEGYTVVNGTPEDPDPADLPVEPGAVAAHWYKSGANWVVVYPRTHTHSVRATRFS
jgi:predicted small lipoprotein YifL